MSDSPTTLRRWLHLTVAYDGTDYAGWQIQLHNPTVQAALLTALQAITGEQPPLTASGRTDAGVHAMGQVVGIATTSPLPCEQLLRGLNAKLPSDIVVRAIKPAPAGFHATHDSLRKLYRYTIHNSRIRPLIDRRYCWYYPQPLDLATMQEAGELLVGRHDFASFETTGSKRSSTVRTIMKVSVEPTGNNTSHDISQDPSHGKMLGPIAIDVQGDGFLYNMVRGIVGTLLEVGRGAKRPEWITEVLAARDRRVAGPNAPARGLMLMQVDYDDAVGDAVSDQG